MKRTVIAGFVATLAACSTAQTDRAQEYQQQIAAACQVAMMVGTVSPVGPWIIGGCATEQAIAKLALDPNGLAWVRGLTADAQKR